MTWWRDAVVYQIYPRSFADSNGDGVGDLTGVRSRLDYLVDLGVDAIWLSPFYPSPMADGGYDVADHCAVDPRFGTLADFDDLVSAAAERGIRIIVDIVPNHCSVEHPRFQTALEAGAGSPERAMFIFRDGRGPDGAEPPNNWQSRFGGRAWTRVPDGQWYLHLFDSSQPDWDWTNPEVPALFEKVIRFWLDRRVGGLRVDAASTMYKQAGLPDDEAPTLMGVPTATTLRPELLDLFRSWRKILDSYAADGFPGARTGVLETWATPEHLRPYFGPGGMHQLFNFLLLLAPWTPSTMRSMIEASLELTDGSEITFPWVLENHDMPRTVSRYGWSTQEVLRFPFPPNGDVVDIALGTRRARAAALLQLALPGSVYVYQGQELGLPEVYAIPRGLRDDPTFVRRNGAMSRDGCRVPLPWSGTTPPFGFSNGSEEAAPWLPQPAEWAALTVEAQRDDPTSMLSLYRCALRQRPSGPLIWASGGDLDAAVIHFRRGDDFACVLNMGRSPVALPAHDEAIIASGHLVAGMLPPDTTVWLRLPSSARR